jgi:tetratricopeptide (TPR) repeat protein
MPQAIEDYDEAIRINPQGATFYKNMGDAYGKLGKSVESERDLKKYRALRD